MTDNTNEPDGYYGEEEEMTEMTDNELDLSFLDDDEKK